MGDDDDDDEGARVSREEEDGRDEREGPMGSAMIPCSWHGYGRPVKCSDGFFFMLVG